MPAERGVVAADQMQRLASEALAVDLTQQAEPSSALIAPNDGVVPPPRATAGANADHTHCPPTRPSVARRHDLLATPGTRAVALPVSDQEPLSAASTRRSAHTHFLFVRPALCFACPPDSQSPTPPCQTRGGLSPPSKRAPGTHQQKKRGSLSRVKSTPKEEGGGDTGRTTQVVIR